ncbi:hypothetical protein [Thalassovita taeanensis]|uniref:Uncharacterized protein n=1 Tax=Thalassovita taeanensis TaxID=657014 RepID=A0A1H9B4J7_9RHOB|nr:hypothetical protein [Thalassovita taeanensis]SEP83759.1 hypothetical protein SAMN04488092_102368 [Thalassovita taeanensis]
MTTFLPKEVQDGLDAARKRALKQSSRMLIEADGKTYRVLRFWEHGFALEAEGAPHLRGLVDLYDRGYHLYQGLIVASSEENGEMCYEFKRLTLAHDKVPLDFAQDETVAVAFLGR